MNKLLALFFTLATAFYLRAQALEITSTGVGIGTTSPGASLDVQIPGNTLGVRIQNDAATTARLLAVSAGNSGWTNGNGVAQFTVGSTSATGRAVTILNSGTGDSLYIDHSGASGNSLIVTGGKVGIGTASPSNKVHIDGTSGTPSSMPLRVDVGDNGSIAVRGASSIGYVGYTVYKDSTQMWFTGRESDNYVVRTGGGANVLTAEYSGAVASTLYLKAGSVGIGTTSPGYKLHVAGSVRATSFISDSTTYADFVFRPGYKLTPLAEVEAAIQRDGRLPGIPSETEVMERGMDLSAMQVKLLQKVEELTLHAIAQEKEIAALRRELTDLKNR